MLIWDTETGPLPEGERAAFDPDDVKIGRLKDPEKIAAKRQEAEVKFHEELALHPSTGRVLAIGVREPEFTVDTIYGDEDEAVLLNRFWSRFRPNEVFVGWNTAAFDLPFITKRSWIHGLHVPSEVATRYSKAFLDLMQVWCLHSYGSYASLDATCELLGIEGKPADVNGKMFSDLWNGGSKCRQKAQDYLVNDLRMTTDVAERLGVL